jgi:membrane protein implicated in regulation of membrane protease activity
VAEGTPVRVTSMEGLKLIVEPVQTPAVTVG